MKAGKIGGVYLFAMGLLETFLVVAIVALVAAVSALLTYLALGRPVLAPGPQIAASAPAVCCCCDESLSFDDDSSLETDWEDWANTLPDRSDLVYDNHGGYFYAEYSPADVVGP